MTDKRLYEIETGREVSELERTFELLADRGASLGRAIRAMEQICNIQRLSPLAVVEFLEDISVTAYGYPEVEGVTGCATKTGWDSRMLITADHMFVDVDGNS